MAFDRELGAACRLGAVGRVAAAMEAGADPGGTWDKQCSNALHQACWKGDPAVVAMLLRPDPLEPNPLRNAGAVRKTICAVNAVGYTPLDLALAESNRDAAETLLAVWLTLEGEGDLEAIAQKYPAALRKTTLGLLQERDFLDETGHLVRGDAAGTVAQTTLATNADDDGTWESS